MKIRETGAGFAGEDRTDPSDVLKRILVDNIRTGKWRPGERLPAERELSEDFGIGRSVVRRVLGQLRAQGLIMQTVGSGTFVADINGVIEDARPSSISTTISPAHLIEARFLLEPAIIDLVVRNATASDLKQMEDCCERAEAAQTVEEFEHWDGALHKVIAEATHNTFFAAIFTLMNQVREQGEWGLLKKKSLTPEHRKLYEREHRNLVSALRDRDSERAKALATGHLADVRRNLLGY
jgi:DNA-binding FadR family transcriptional regulator